LAIQTAIDQNKKCCLTFCIGYSNSNRPKQKVLSHFLYWLFKQQ
jgi:hypothetical protein